MNKRLRSAKSRTRIQKLNEALEPRLMMAAQVVSQIGSKTLAIGTTPSPITLSTYLDDSVIPSGDTVIEFTTNLPAPNNEFPVVLTNAATPNTVANFISYITSGAYADTIIHRSVPGFVIQGGGYNTSGSAIPANAAIDGESATATLKNTTGTIAMALSTGPNSATNEWFFNLADNPELDDTSDGGPFTAFGQVIYNGLTAIDAIAAVPVYNASSSNGAWSDLPLYNYNTSVGSFDTSNFVQCSPMVNSAPLTYTTVSSAPGKVTATITNGNLQLTPVAAGNADITVTLTDLGGGTATETIPVTVVAPVVPTVSVGAASGTIGSDSQITFPVTLEPAASAAVTLAYTTTAGTAAAGDFTATTGTLTIPAGATSASVSVPIVKDSTDADETFSLNLSGLSSNAAFSGGSATLSAVGTIDPQAVVSHPILSIASASATAVTDSQIAFPVSLSIPVSTAVTFQYTTTAGTAPAGDFTATTGSITIPAGATATTVDVPILKDSTDSPETFTITLGSLTTNATFAGGAVDDSATGTIEPAPAVATLTSIAASGEAFALGSSGTFTASVATAAGAAVTTGSVAFVENGTTVGTVALNSSGDAVFTQAFTATGNLSVEAEYTGTTGVDLTSTSSAVVVSVTTLTPTTGKTTLPTSIVAGTAASGTAVVTVTNSQTTTAKGAISVSVYAAPAGTTVGSPILLQTVKKSVNLATGKSVTIGVPVKLKAGAIPAGTYTIISETTDTKGNLSTATTGPTLTVGPATVDFTATVARLTAPAKVVAGTKTKAAVTLSIDNGGNSTSKSPLSISLYASTTGTAAGGTLIRTVPEKTAIKAGKSATITVPISAYPAVADGNYAIVAVITDASGNTATAVSPSTINIAAATVQLAATATTVPAAGTVGKAIAVSVTFVNNGNVNATASVPMLLQLSVDGTAATAIDLGTVDVKTNLAPGKTETAKFKVTIPAGFEQGAYYLITTVDSTNVLNEPTLADNTVTSATTISIT